MRRLRQFICRAKITFYKPVTASVALKGMLLPGLWIGGILCALASGFEGIACRYSSSSFNREAFLVFLLFSAVYALCSENLTRICEGRKCLIWGKAEEIPQIIILHATFWMPVVVITYLLEGAKWISPWFMVGACPAILWMLWGEYVAKGIRKNGIRAEEVEKAYRDTHKMK